MYGSKGPFRNHVLVERRGHRLLIPSGEKGVPEEVVDETGVRYYSKVRSLDNWA